MVGATCSDSFKPKPAMLHDTARPSTTQHDTGQNGSCYATPRPAMPRRDPSHPIPHAPWPRQRPPHLGPILLLGSCLAAGGRACTLRCGLRVRAAVRAACCRCRHRRLRLLAAGCRRGFLGAAANQLVQHGKAAPLAALACTASAAGRWVSSSREPPPSCHQWHTALLDPPVCQHRPLMARPSSPRSPSSFPAPAPPSTHLPQTALPPPGGQSRCGWGRCPAARHTACREGAGQPPSIRPPHAGQPPSIRPPHARQPPSIRPPHAASTS
jgi:hypothetical protein